MKSFLVAMPILPGKTGVWKDNVSAFMKDFETPEGKQLLEKGGIKRVRLWHAKTPDGGDLAIVLHEGPAPERWLSTVMESSGPLAEKFRAMATEVHGFTPEAAKNAPPPPELVGDFDL